VLSQRQFSEIAADLARLEFFLHGLGLHKGRDRLRQLAAHVTTIEQTSRSGTLDALTERDDVEDLVWSLVDAVEFSDIYAGLHSESPEILKPLFRKDTLGQHILGSDLNDAGSCRVCKGEQWPKSRS
jgi:hypothetical protein